MSKSSNHAKLRVLKTWLDANITIKPKKKKQAEWLKDEDEK